MRYVKVDTRNLLVWWLQVFWKINLFRHFHQSETEVRERSSHHVVAIENGAVWVVSSQLLCSQSGCPIAKRAQTIHRPRNFI